jgi:hypothetical protein
VSSTLVASLARDAFVWLGIPALVYGSVLAAGTWILWRRASRAQALAFGAPSIGAVIAIAIALSLFVAIGTGVADGTDPNGPTFVSWGRIVLVGLYTVIVIAAAVAAHFLSVRPGGGGVKVASVTVVAAFLFVAVSAPFSAYMNACHIGNAILINSETNCGDVPDAP